MRCGNGRQRFRQTVCLLQNELWTSYFKRIQMLSRLFGSMSTCLWLQKDYKIPRCAYSSVVRNEFLLCETKLIAAAERNRCVWTQAELVMVTKRCNCMLTVLAGEHPSYCWIIWEVLFQTSLLFWKIPFREQNQFLFHHCMDQLKSDLLPSCPGEIIALHNFSRLLCSGRKCKTMVLGRILLQGTLVPQ